MPHIRAKPTPLEVPVYIPHSLLVSFPQGHCLKALSQGKLLWLIPRMEDDPHWPMSTPTEINVS